ncbi:MAG: branched-chain amino acid ABC transporter permease [Nitrospinae bacterium]|nr:branched-chain amino acid ABC transporter permease [Nitrospinota bacterium]
MKPGSRLPVLLMLLVGLALVPWLLNPYLIFVTNLMFIYVILALGLNWLLGYTGQFAFANAAFFGIGAYAAGLLQVKLGISFWLALPAAGFITAAIGMVIGLPALRLSGLYLALVTLAFAQLTQWVMIHWDTFTFGAGGFKSPAPSFKPLPLGTEQGVYYLSLAVAVLLTALAWNITRSKIGRAFVAIRDSEVAAQALAIDLAAYKTLAFALSAFYAGLAGALYSAALRFVAPEGFDLFQMVLHFSMVVVGGLASIAGSILGAVLILVLQEVLRMVKGAQEILFGTLLMLTIIFLPDGLASFLRRIAPAWREPLHRSTQAKRIVVAGTPDDVA